MDGREGMALSGSASYYLNRGGGVGGSSSGSHVIGIGGGGSLNPTGIGLHTPHGFKTLQNANLSVHSNAVRGGGNMGSTYQLENPSSNYSRGINMSMAMASSVSPSETGKKKRGRPRKYALDGANMQLRLSSMASTQSPGSVTPGGAKKSRGRPPGSGWKQRLAPFGDWMNSTAGLAFTPHVIHAGVGEDIAAKILSFAQQRPRALCILSANGSVSAVTLKQPTSGGSVTYEGRFEILCLSGSYLLAESGGPRNRTGGLSISVCSPDGHVIGGAIGGKLVASSLVQVVVCSFVYGSTKGKSKSEGSDKDDKSSVAKLDDKTSTLLSAASSQDPIGNSGTGGGGWPPVSRQDLRNPLTDIDLTRG